MSIDKVILLLTCCFAAVLLALLYMVFRDRLKDRINRTGSSISHKKRKTDVIKTGALIDYNMYQMTAKEKLVCILAAAVAIISAVYVFYRSFMLAFLLSPLALLYPKLQTKENIRRRKAELNLQFREALYSVASSLSAGKSIETAMADAQKELAIQYPDADTYILIELEQINRRVGMNETIEEALYDFAVRSHLEDIMNFTDVFAICKRTGGNLVQVVKNTAEIISEKIDVKQEINVLLTEKKLEHKVLNLMPVFIVLMLSTSAEEFMAPVFTEPLGRAAMTISLMLFSAAYFVSRKIMDIEV